VQRQQLEADGRAAADHERHPSRSDHACTSANERTSRKFDHFSFFSTCHNSGRPDCVANQLRDRHPRARLRS
jgi:hypothetical protein